MYFDLSDYKQPMKEFLNDFMSAHRHFKKQISKEKMKSVFLTTITAVMKSLGEKPFRLRVALNTAIFDSVMVGLARRAERGPLTSTTQIKSAYDKLLSNVDYLSLCGKATANEQNVKGRMKIATEAFDSIE